MAVPNNYKNGGVAVLGAINIVCRIVKRYGPKLIQFIANLQTAGKLTSLQATTATDFLNTINDVCAVYQIIAQQTGA